MTLRRQIRHDFEQAKLARRIALEARIRAAHEKFREGLTNEREDLIVQPDVKAERLGSHRPRGPKVWHHTGKHTP